MIKRKGQNVCRNVLLIMLLVILLLAETIPAAAEDLWIKGIDNHNPSNPVHHCTKREDGTDYTSWDYIYFGSYPQTEITGSKLTNAITGADYNSDGDAWIDGVKYRRINKSQTNNSEFFGNKKFRYFKWERIKWKVLYNNKSSLFVMADQALDCKDYNSDYKCIPWESCSLRKWLNDTFYDTAFSSSEQAAIEQKNVINEDNLDSGAKGGNNTRDKVYLLSNREVTNFAYGFCTDGNVMSASRRMQTSDFAYIRGAYRSQESEYQNNCIWLLRSPGSDTSPCSYVNVDGWVEWFRKGNETYDDAILPVLNLKISSNMWYFENDGSSGAGGEDSVPGENMGKKVTGISIQLPSSKLAVGKKVKLTAKVTPANAVNKKLNWKSSNEKYAEIDKKGNLIIKKAGAGKTVTITATATDGSGKKDSCKIKLMKHAVQSVKIIKPTKSVVAGKSVKLKVSVKTTGKDVNKKLLWSTSNKKYATVDSKGKVTAKKAGKGKTVTITAAATDGSNKKAQAKIRIK